MKFDEGSAWIPLFVCRLHSGHTFTISAVHYDSISHLKENSGQLFRTIVSTISGQLWNISSITRNHPMWHLTVGVSEIGHVFRWHTNRDSSQSISLYGILSTYLPVHYPDHVIHRIQFIFTRKVIVLTLNIFHVIQLTLILINEQLLPANSILEFINV